MRQTPLYVYSLLLSLYSPTHSYTNTCTLIHAGYPGPRPRHLLNVRGGTKRTPPGPPFADPFCVCVCVSCQMAGNIQRNFAANRTAQEARKKKVGKVHRKATGKVGVGKNFHGLGSHCCSLLLFVSVIVGWVSTVVTVIAIQSIVYSRQTVFYCWPKANNKFQMAQKSFW